ncbi:hypothetical protein D2Q93_15545 [Alicyclobacillaceae bacterium I2511]|nr:hypothetical protein D2Q93_15545 [Alicyclobacillaceae bacterium I2511]
MRIARIRVDLTADDINLLLLEWGTASVIRVTGVTSEGIRGQVKLLWWGVDFLAKPGMAVDGSATIEVSAFKLVPIPSALVEKRLREAMKDAPSGIDVIQQTLKVHLQSLLRPFGTNLNLAEFQCHDGYVRIGVDGLTLPRLQDLFAAIIEVGNGATGNGSNGV